MAANRLANADHLFGMAVECGLKRLMIVFGMQVRADGSPDGRDDRQHADRVWLRYETYRSGSHQGTAYATPNGQPFADWDVSQRYAHQRNFDDKRVLAHQSAALAVSGLMKRARADGLIP